MHARGVLASFATARSTPLASPLNKVASEIGMDEEGRTMMVMISRVGRREEKPGRPCGLPACGWP